MVDPLPDQNPFDKIQEVDDRAALIVAPKHGILTRKAQFIREVIMLSLLLAILVIDIGITVDNNQKLDQTNILVERNRELELALEDAEFVIRNAVAAIQGQCAIIEAAGEECPEIVLLPPERPDD